MTPKHVLFTIPRFLVYPHSSHELSAHPGPSDHRFYAPLFSSIPGTCIRVGRPFSPKPTQQQIIVLGFWEAAKCWTFGNLVTWPRWVFLDCFLTAPLNKTNKFLSFGFCSYLSIQKEILYLNPPSNTGDVRDAGLIPGSRRSPGEGNGNPLQYSCLENPMDRGAWWTTGSHRGGHDWSDQVCIHALLVTILQALRGKHKASPQPWNFSPSPRSRFSYLCMTIIHVDDFLRH